MINFERSSFIYLQSFCKSNEIVMALVTKQIVQLFKYFIFWMIYFWLAKAFFLISNFELTRQLSVSEVFGIFGYGLKMDVSTACYLLIVPGVLLSLRIFIPSWFIRNCSKLNIVYFTNNVFLYFA